MKYLVKARILAFAAIMATGTFAFGQGANSVIALPTQLPAGASVIAGEDHHFVQVFTIDLAADATPTTVTIQFPSEITIADVDLSGGAISDEIYFTNDAVVVGGLLPAYASYVADLLTINIGGASIANNDYLTIIVPVEVDATPVTDLTYTITAEAGPLTANVDIVSGPLTIMSFDDDATGEGLIDLATTGSQYANIRGKFHPNTVAAHGNFLSAASLNMVDEDGPAAIAIVAAAAPADPWLSTWDALSVADGDGEITYSLWASQDRSLLRTDLGSGAIPVNDYLTATDLTANDGAALAGLIDLTLLNPDGYWFFYLTSSATADWFLSSSDSMFVSHAPALIDPLTDLVASGAGNAVNDGSGKGAGIDYATPGVFDNTDGGTDDPDGLTDPNVLTIDGGTVLDYNGVVSSTAADNIDVFWFVDDVDDDARLHVFVVADTATYDTSDVIVTLGVVTGIGSGVGEGIEITTTAFYEDDDTNWVNLSVVSPSVLTANATNYIYLVMYDGTYKTVELIRDVETGLAEPVVTLVIRHHPYIEMHDLWTADNMDWDTGINEYYPISWGWTYNGDKDPDAAAATITLYAVETSVGLWATVTGAGDVSNPATPLAGLVGGGAYVIAPITDDADTREDNRYMWDIRSSGIPDGTYEIWATMEDGSDMLTMQLNSTPSALLAPAGANDRSVIVRHGQNFLANNPYEGEAVELTQDDIYEFTWQEATSSNSDAGEVKLLLVPENVTPGAIEYLSATNGVVIPTNISGPVFTPAAVLTESNDITLAAAASYTGTEPAIYKVVTVAAGAYDWYVNDVLVGTNVAFIAGVNVLADGMQFVAGAIGGHTVDSYWEFYAFPIVANASAYYWIHPTLDGTAGLEGTVATANTNGFTGSTNKAQLTVEFLTDDYGAAGVTPAAAAVAGGFKYYDVYYFYAPDGSLDGLDGAVTPNTGVTLDDITVVSTYAGSTPHTYVVNIDVAAVPDQISVTKDGITIYGPAVIAAATPYDMGDGISVEFAANTGHALNDNWTFRVDGHVATKADGQLYFNGEGGNPINYRVTASSIPAEKGDTLDFTLQVTYVAGIGPPGVNVALAKVYLDFPSSKLSVLGTADSAMTPVTASGFVPFTNDLGAGTIDYEAYITGGKNWDNVGTTHYTDGEWVDLATFRVLVIDSYSGGGLEHNLITFSKAGSRVTSMADENLTPLSMLVNDNAVDVQLYRRGSITGSVEFEGRAEDGESVTLFVAPSGSYTTISDADFLTSNGDADASDGIQILSLGAGGLFTLTDVPTGDYDIVVSKPGFLSQKTEAPITVQPTSATTVNFQNADKMLGGDIAGYIGTDGQSYPDNQVGTLDETKLVSLLGTTPSTTPDTYADLDGSGGEIDIADLSIVVKNVAGVDGEGLLYKEMPISGTNEDALVCLSLLETNGDEATYVIKAKDMVSLRGFAARMEINPDEWDIVSFVSGLSSYGGARNHQIVAGFDATLYSASRLWNGIIAEEMDLAIVTLTAKVGNATPPTLSEVTLVDVDFASIKAVIDASAGLPEEFSLSQNFPNPFNPTTTINFALPDAGKVRLAVYNLLGQEVRSLVSGAMDAGSYKAVWNSMDNTGRKVSSGVYFYRLVVDGKIVNTRKMLLLK